MSEHDKNLMTSFMNGPIEIFKNRKILHTIFIPRPSLNKLDKRLESVTREAQSEGKWLFSGGDFNPPFFASVRPSAAVSFYAGEKNLRGIVKGWNVDDYLSYQTELRILYRLLSNGITYNQNKRIKEKRLLRTRGKPINHVDRYSEFLVPPSTFTRVVLIY